jgi:hypothetical protein
MKGAEALVLPFAVILLFVTFFVILPMYAPPAVTIAEAGPAVALANQIKSLPAIDNQQCQGVSTTVANTITILQAMDGTIGTGFRVAQFDASNCDIVIQYLPVLGTYNSLILASRTLDPNNQTSVKVFYEDAFLLSSDFIIINDKVAYNIAFKSTGEMNDALGLARLQSKCGDECYRVVLSGIHWTIRIYMGQFLCQFESWASQYVKEIPYHPC